MAGEFRREYLLRLPLPLAQLYGRAHNAPAARARHDNTFYLFEALVKLTACPLVADYLRQVDRGEPRVPALDRLLAQLVLPSLGQWVAILRGLARHFNQRPDADTHPLGNVWRQLDAQRRDCPGILALYRRIKNGPDGAAGGDQSCSLMQLIDALVLYRNTVFGHGAGRCDSFYEVEMGPLLAPAASELFAEGVLDLLGPRGTRLVYVSEMRILDDRQIEVSLSDLVGLESERMTPLTLSADAAPDLAPNCVAVLWPGQRALLRLDPLLVFRGGELTDEVLFLNRDRNGQQVEYLSYTTGRIDRDRALAPAMARLLARITGRDVTPEELAEFARRSLAETSSVESLFESTAPQRRTLGDYEILAEIGRGGMGIVYLARQLSLGRLVALKMLPADVAGDESALARFRREMRALGRCEHPNIVKVLASGTLPDGQLFYAMEYIPGADLEMVWRELAGPHRQGTGSTLGGTTWGRAVLSASQKQRDQAERRASGEPTVAGVRAGVATEADGTILAQSVEPFVRAATFEPLPLPPLPSLPDFEDDPGGFFRRAASLVRDAAFAVQAVHDQNIVHRDIKPANLLLTPDGSRVVLMDFGLAKGQGLTRTATRSAGFLGTLRYAAPEQLASAKIHVGPQADVRALGVTLWELLSRQRLFDDADDENQMASWVLTRDVPPLRDVDSTIDPDLEAIVARATEREVDRRIQTARELADYLQLYLDGKPLPIRRPGTAEVLARWMHEHKPLVGATLAATAAVIAVSIAAFLFVLAAWRGQQVVNQQLDVANQKLSSSNDQLQDSKVTLEKTNQSLQKTLAELSASTRSREEALVREQASRQEAQANEQRALANQRLAERRETEAQKNLYASRMLLAHQSLQTDELARATEQLDLRSWGGDRKQYAGFRNWEWSYLDGLAHARLTELRGMSKDTSAIAWSSDGKWIAAGDAGGMVLVFNADTAQVADLWSNRRRQLVVHTDRITAIQFSHDNKFVATSSWDDAVLIQAVDDPKQTTRVSGFGDGSYDLAFSPDDRLLAVAGSDGQVHLIDVRSATRTAKLPGHVGIVRSVAFHPDGRQIASAGEDGTLRLWNVETRKQTETLVQRDDAIHRVLYHPNGKRLLEISNAGVLTAWDLTSSQIIFENHAATRGTSSLAFDRTGNTLAVGVYDGNVAQLTFKETSLDLQRVLHPHAARVLAVALSPDGRYLASSSADGTIRITDSLVDGRSEQALTRTFESIPSGNRRLYLSPDGRRLFVCSMSRITVHDAATGRLLAGPGGVFEELSGRMRGLSLSSDTSLAAFGVRDGSLRIVQTRDGQLIRRLPLNKSLRHEAMITRVAFSPDAKRLVSVDRARNISVWNTENGELVHQFQGDGGKNLNTLVFSPDGRWLVTGFGLTKLQIWDLASGELLNELAEDRPCCAQFDPDGTRLYVGGYHSVISVWDMATYRVVQRLRGHRGPVTDLAFSANGSRLTSAGGDGMIILWEPQSAQQMLTLGRMEGQIGSLRFSPDGRSLIAAAQEEKSFWMWDAPALSPDPKQREDWFALTRRGDLRMRLSQWTAARYDYTLAVVRGAEDPYVWANHGWATFREGDISTALIDFERALKLSPDDGAIWLLRDQVAAASLTPVATKLPPKDNWAALIEIGTDHLWDFRHDRERERQDPADWRLAALHLSGWIDAQQGHADWRAYRNRGVAWMAAKEYKQAETDFAKAAELQPADAKNWQALARAQAEQQKYQEAIVSGSKAIELDPAHWQHWYVRSNYHRQALKYKEALSDSDQALRLEPKLWMLLAERQYLLAREGDGAAARAGMDQLMQRFAGEDSDAHYEAAQLYSRIADALRARKDDQRKLALEAYGAAAKHLRDVARLRPSGKRARNLALCLQLKASELVEQKQLEAAVEPLLESLQAIDEANEDVGLRDPAEDLVSILEDLGSLYQDLDRLPDAIHMARRRVEVRRRQRLDDDDVTKRRDLAGAYGTLGWRLLLNGQYAEGGTAAAQGLDIDPSRMWIRVNLAHACLLLGYYDRAEAIYLKYKDERLNKKQTFREAVLEDFELFRKRKMEHPDMERIEKLLRVGS